MARQSATRPTDAELSILRVLWDRGPSTVRQVHEIMARDRSLAYTTTLKLLQIMTEKGLVTRREEDRYHIYEPAVPQEEAQRQLVGDLLDRAFGGSAAALVMQALAARRASDEDLDAIRRMLDEREREARAAREDEHERD